MGTYMQTGGSTTAGGYPDYTKFCTPRDTKQFIDKFWCTSLFEGVPMGKMLSGLTELGQTVRFYTSGKPNVYNYVKNGGMQFDVLSACPVDYKLDKIRYSAYKYDLTDVNNCMYPELRRKWREDVPKVHAEKFDSDVLCTLPTFASACTQGNHAGASGDVQLGTDVSPVAVSNKLNPPTGTVSIFEYLTRGPEVMGTFNLPTNGTVIAFVPDKVKMFMLNSEYANNAGVNGQGSAWIGTFANGYCGDAISMRCGAEVRSSTCIKKVGTFDVNGVPKPVYRIIWLWKPGFSAVNLPKQMIDGEYAGSPMGRLDIRMTISGAAVSHREGVVVGYIYLAD